MSTYPDLHLYINGEWRKTVNDLPVLNPATEEEIGRLPHAEKVDLDDALDAAANGFRVWSHVAPVDRANVLYKAAALMRERQEEIATAITAEHGKPLNQARLEVIRGCEFFEWDAGEATRTYGRVIPSAPGVRYFVHHQPIGIVAAFSPWNFPMPAARWREPSHQVVPLFSKHPKKRLLARCTLQGPCMTPASRPGC
jgi:succinate-semialdehyde dehydrogenase/glutarate-semialdehyde dehydrogenase